MLVNINEICNQTKSIAIPQFDINNLEWTRYILETCEELKNPVILGVNESTISYMGGVNTIVNIVVGLMIDLKITIPVAIHLDHGTSFEICREAIDAGFTSIMYDGSLQNIEQNISETSKIVDYAHKYHVSVEGKINICDSNTHNSNYNQYINYIASTGVDAINLTQHEKDEDQIDNDLIKKLKDNTNTILVLKSDTKIPNNINEILKSGINKINIGNDLQISWSTALRNYLTNNPNNINVKEIISSGQEQMTNRIREIISNLNKIE